MKLKAKVWILWIAASSVIAAVFSVVLFIRLREDRLSSIERSISKQLGDVAFSLSGFFGEIEADVLTLTSNPDVRTRNDKDFTSFLGADEATFRYRYGAEERKIIGLFNAYRLAHTYVNSVYMGRENGSFVRSHPRERPTEYDPRTRPWYVVAKSNPASVLETEAYPSLTTNDVNIGVVKALVGDDGAPYGVVGMDVTLAALTDYLMDYRVSSSGILVLVDSAGTILASQDARMRARKLEEFHPAAGAALARNDGNPSGSFTDGGMLVIFRRIARPDWSALALVPEKDIASEVGFPVALAVVLLLAGLVLFGALTLAGLRLLVVDPLGRLTAATERVTETSAFVPAIAVRSHDEIGSLADSFNRMMERLAKKEWDLTQYRDNLEELVAERESQYRDLLESANSIILRWRPDGEIVFINKRAQEFFGYTESEIVGRSIFGTIVEEGGEAPAELKAFAAAVAAGGGAKEHIQRVNQNVRSSGEKVWVTWSNKPIKGRDGGVGEVLSIGADITQLVRTESELRRALLDLARAKEMAETADRLKSSFLATMSHELRTPLNSIIGFTGILLQKLSGPLNAEQEKQLDMVQTSSRHLLSLISDVLDISKIEAGQLRVSFDSVRAEDVIRPAVQSVLPLAEKQGLRLVVEVDPGVSALQTDRRRLEQVLLNLLGNAVKFTEKGSVRVRCTVSGGDLVFTVSDTGIGIGAKDLEGLFKPFQQLDTGLTRRFEGTGLGLSISKKLVELMGGSIWAESTLNEGSTFGFRLPINRSAP